jgi:carbon-monoxide dehydrogenase large subunit
MTVGKDPGGAPARLVGAPVPRLEDGRFLTGTATFIDDLRLAGMTYAVVVRSPHAHARVLAIDAGAARAIPGIVDVVTAADIADHACDIPIRLGPLPGFHRFLQRPLASDTVRFVGEPVAVIIAEDRLTAEDAAQRLPVEYRILQPVTTVAEALAEISIIHDKAGTNLATSYLVTHGGDVEAAFAAAAYTRREVLQVHRQTALPMECRGLLAAYDPQAEPYRLRMWGATKVTHFNRRALADLLRLPLQSIELIEVDVGGSFGARGELYPEDFLIPFAAMRLRRPVKWIEDRREHLMATNHSRDVECELEMAFAEDGAILGLRGRIRADLGAYVRTNGGVVPSKTAQFLPGPYRIPSIALQVEALITNKTPVGTLRGPGLFEGNFFRERMLDLAAADLGLSPVDIRLRNMIRPAEMPYPAPQLVPHEPADTYDSGDFPAALRRALDEIGYADLVRRPALTGPVRHGVGLCSFVESTGAGPAETARLMLEDDGRVKVHVGISAAGQGHETVLAQIAADELGAPLDSIMVLHGTTSLVEHGFGTYHSRAAVMGGSAVLLAARKLRHRIMSVAGRRLNLGSTDLDLRGGAVVRREHDGAAAVLLPFSAVAAAAREMSDEPMDGAALEETARFEQTSKTFAYGAHVAHVAVDIETGRVEVLRYVVVEDIGRSINPLITHGQVIGGAVQGLGSVLLDEIVYDRQGQLLTVNLADYLLATSTELPNVEVISMDLARSTLNPLGIKGAGEGGIVATGAALANAVANALSPLGVKITRLPLNPSRLWQQLDAAGD